MIPSTTDSPRIQLVKGTVVGRPQPIESQRSTQVQATVDHLLLGSFPSLGTVYVASWILPTSAKMATLLRLSSKRLGDLYPGIEPTTRVPVSTAAEWTTDDAERLQRDGRLIVPGSRWASVLADFEIPTNDPWILVRGEQTVPACRDLVFAVQLAGLEENSTAIIERVVGLVRWAQVESERQYLESELRHANAWITREGGQIAELQQSFLPETLPDIQGLSFHTYFETFDRAGGDYFRLMPLTPEATLNGAWAFLVADASGHGPSAAVLTAMAHAILNTYPREDRGPADILEYLNRHLLGPRFVGSFMTAFVGIYTPADYRFRYACAGHPPPLVKAAGVLGEIEALEAAGGIPLGILPATGTDEAERVFGPGETLVLYTDGITEARSPDGEMFGLRGIRRTLAVCSGSPECVVESITGTLRNFEAGRRPADDQSLIVVRFE